MPRFPLRTRQCVGSSRVRNREQRSYRGSLASCNLKDLAEQLGLSPDSDGIRRIEQSALAKLRTLLGEFKEDVVGEDAVGNALAALCTVPGCLHARRAKGLCNMHYLRARAGRNRVLGGRSRRRHELVAA